MNVVYIDHIEGERRLHTSEFERVESIEPLYDDEDNRLRVHFTENRYSDFPYGVITRIE